MPRRTSRAGRRTARILLGVGALTALLALVVGVPLILLAAWRYLGPPLPSARELTGPDDGTLFVRVLCLAGWVGWATFTWAVLAELLAQWRGWRLPAWGWQQRTAAAILSAVAMMLTAPAVVSATASPVRAAPAVVGAAAPASGRATAHPDAMPRTAPVGWIEHVVQPGEQMPALAERFLGDKYQWHAIATASYGISQPDGRQLHPGDTRVYPGWTVRIPAPATADAAPLTTVAHTATVPATVSAPTGSMVYEASHGDWVWHVAERFLGDPLRYSEIAKLNLQLVEKYGAAFPDHLEPGETLYLPADAHDQGSREHATGVARSTAPTAPGDSPGTSPAPHESGPAHGDPTPPQPGRSPSPTGVMPGPTSSARSTMPIWRRARI